MRVSTSVFAMVYSLSERSSRKSFSPFYTVVVNRAFQESPAILLTHSPRPDRVVFVGPQDDNVWPVRSSKRADKQNARVRL